jgi:Ca-activated chloride channel family protein
MNAITFRFPENASLFLLILAVALFMIRSDHIRKVFLRAIGSDPQKSIPPRRGLKRILQILGLSVLVLAAMGPQWGQKAHPVKAEGLDLCFALDLSRSMYTEDLAPNRLEQAKNQLEIFLGGLGGDRATIVGFAGGAFIAAPLSIDSSALSTFLMPLSPAVVSDQGTDLSLAVETCLSALGLDGVSDRNVLLDDAAKLIVLITDGEETVDDKRDAIKRAEKLGVPIFSMAVGTAKGAPIPIRDEGQIRDYVRDPATNQPVVSRLQDKALVEIARKTGGQVFYAYEGLPAWKRFEDEIAGFKRQSRDAGTKLDKEDRFQWPALVAWILLFVEWVLMEGKAILLVMLIFGAWTTTAQASDRHLNPQVVWKNRQAMKKFENDDFKGAEEKWVEALGQDASHPRLRLNWIAAKLRAAVGKTPEDPKSIDSKAATEAFQELEQLSKEKTLSPELQEELTFQKAQALELLNKNTEALSEYYKVLANSGKHVEGASHNIARLLFSQSQKQNSKGQGGGEGNSKNQDQSNSPDKKDSKSKFSQEKRASKYNGTDVDEKQAQQILESVSGEEREVMKRRAQGLAKERMIEKNRENRENGQRGRGKDW